MRKVFWSLHARYYSRRPVPEPTSQAPTATEAQAYVPQAVYCVAGNQPLSLCSTIPGNIGPDPALEQPIAYNGIVGLKPTSAEQ